MYRHLLLTTFTMGGLQLCAPRIAAAVTFEGYDYDRYSREVTERDRLAADGRDPGSLGVAAETLSPGRLRLMQRRNSGGSQGLARGGAPAVG